MSNRIIAHNNNYQDLLCYKKSVVIYDLTFLFCSRYIDKHDRTHDQMVQAARSGKQNIVEGTIDSGSSVEMGIKLLNVARGSLKELLEDYKDYLRVRNMRLWEQNSKEVEAMRRLGVEKQESEYFTTIASTRNDETIANMAIVLIYQADILIIKYIEYLENRFKQEGGIKEKMYKIRTQERGY